MFEAHSRVYDSTLGSRVMKKKGKTALLQAQMHAQWLLIYVCVYCTYLDMYVYICVFIARGSPRSGASRP